jgi:CrcB protein
LRSTAVLTGGTIGALARWWVSAWLPPTPPAFPWATLTVNVVGAFGLGLLGVILMEQVLRGSLLRSFLAIGVLGSFTTFSTMAVEGVVLFEAGRPEIALGYWMATLVLGMMAAVMGMVTARWTARRERI